jgi:hypothetical protein
VAALGADQPGDILFQHDLEHLQAGPDRQGEQSLAGSADGSVASGQRTAG